MQTLKHDWSDQTWRRFMAFGAGAMVLFYMLVPVAPLRWHDLYLSYGKTAIVALAAIYFFRARLDGVKEVKLVIWYAIWMFLTRLFNTDLYLQNELDLVISRVLCCVVLPVGLMLEEKERRVMLDAVIALVGAFYFVTALVSLYACIFGVYFYVGPEQVVFGLDNIDVSFPYVICFEGVYDSVFVKNGVCIGGKSLTPLQEQIISLRYPRHRIVLAFDNDAPGREATRRTIERTGGKFKYFKWYSGHEPAKDINDYVLETGDVSAFADPAVVEGLVVSPVVMRGYC
jgi:hypothetical protein